MINGMIKFIREKGMKPSSKLLSGETVFTDYATAGEDTNNGLGKRHYKHKNASQ